MIKVIFLRRLMGLLLIFTTIAMWGTTPRTSAAPLDIPGFKERLETWREAMLGLNHRDSDAFDRYHQAYLNLAQVAPDQATWNEGCRVARTSINVQRGWSLMQASQLRLVENANSAIDRHLLIDLIRDTAPP